MTRPELGPAIQMPVLVGTTGARGPRIAKRLFTAVSRTAVTGGFAAGLLPLGMTWPWLGALCAVVLVVGLAAGLRRDVRSVGQLGLATAPTRRLFLRGPWVTRSYELAEVVAVQVWCGCGSVRRTVAPHRDGMEVLLSGDRSVRVESDTAFPANVAVTLGELLAPAGIKVVDWGEAGAISS